jgi:SAM-dependent methyltransferase
MDEVRDFFERSAHEYRGMDQGMAPFHRVTAARIERGIAGTVLSLGGTWAQASDHLPGVRLIVADLSIAMLASDRGPAAGKVACDGQRPAFRHGSFDHVVLPLVLHHVTGRTFASARAGARRVLEQVRPLLRSGGHLWVSDFCTSAGIYFLQRLLVPVTRRVLDALHEPLVVMHTASFYRNALTDTGWRDIVAAPVRTPGTGRLDWVRPLIAAPWFRVPRVAYPLRATIITAMAP